MTYPDALTDFVFMEREAPYTLHGIRVFPVRHKAPYGCAARSGWSTIHHLRGVAAVIEDGRVRYGARWMCRAHLGSTDATLISASAVPAAAICERCPEGAPGPCVYRCYGEDGVLLYVGSTKQLGERRAHHTRHAPWWPQVARVDTQLFTDLTQARLAEAVAIGVERPLHNKRGPRKFTAA